MRPLLMFLLTLLTVTQISPATYFPSQITSTTSPFPTITTTPPSPTTHVGCFHDGKWYPAGSDISKGSDSKGWCYGLYCTADGQVLAWDNFNCNPTTTEPPSPSSTATSPVPATTTPPSQTTHVGCFQDGKWYPAGSDISKGSDSKGWCYGLYCTADGQVLAWDNFNCNPSPSTTAASPVPATTTLVSSLALGYFLNIKLSE